MITSFCFIEITIATGNYAELLAPKIFLIYYELIYLCFYRPNNLEYSNSNKMKLKDQDSSFKPGCFIPSEEFLSFLICKDPYWTFTRVIIFHIFTWDIHFQRIKRNEKQAFKIFGITYGLQYWPEISWILFNSHENNMKRDWIEIKFWNIMVLFWNIWLNIN